MRASRMDWVKLPTSWIEAGGLKMFRWIPNGGTRIAALLTLIVLAQHADQEEGWVRITYDRLCLATGLSRAKVSAALKMLVMKRLIARAPDLGQSGYQLVDFDPSADWGKLPHRRLYAGDGSMPAFADFTLRSMNELNALKLYLLFVARRNRNTNFVNLTYDKIEAYSGIERFRIKAALNVLAAQNLVHIDHVKSLTHELGVASAYRLVHIDAYHHMGTVGRGMEPVDFTEKLF